MKYTYFSKMNIQIDQQLNYDTNSDPGHGLILAGNAIIPFEDDFPKKTELYKMLTTKIEEVTAGV